MKKVLLVLGIAGLLALIYFFFSVSVKNNLVDKDESVEAQWANVETSYQRRADLIPNLVNTVKGVAEFEKSTLVEVTQARANLLSALAGGSGNVKNVENAQSQLGVAMGKFFGYTERYPELKANQNFLELQSQLEGTENRIAVERRKFNLIVRDYNTYIKKFPGNLFSADLGYEEKEFFTAAKGAEEAPKVEF